MPEQESEFKPTINIGLNDMGLDDPPATAAGMQKIKIDGEDIDTAVSWGKRILSLIKNPMVYRIIVMIAASIGYAIDPTKLTLFLSLATAGLSIIEMVRREQREGKPPLTIIQHVWEWIMEPSTQRGLIGLLASVGVIVEPELVKEFAGGGLGLLATVETGRALKKDA